MSAAPQKDKNPRSFVARVLSSWPDFRGATAREIARDPSEASILAYIMGGFMGLFLVNLPTNIRAMQGQGEDQIVMSFVAFLLFCPLLFYGVAAMMRMLGLAFGGEASWKTARIAAIWAVWMSLPLLLVRAALAPMVLSMGVEAGYILDMVVTIGVLWIWASAISAAHGFRSVALVAGIMFAILVLVPLLFVLLGQLV